MNYFWILIFFILIAGFIMLYVTHKHGKKYGILIGDRMYVDTRENPGEILYAKTLPLTGKPDYLIRTGNTIIPVEVKTGTTPNTPYPNNVAQLMAYCILVSENYGIRPTDCYIRYPLKEFKLEFTEEAEKNVRSLISEMLKIKETNNEQHCNHPEHNFGKFGKKSVLNV